MTGRQEKYYIELVKLLRKARSLLLTSILYMELLMLIVASLLAKELIRRTVLFCGT
jgi:hypothetical protein